MPAENVLYYGDNLDVLRRHVADETVDLVYLDPPFNSNATYNVLFGNHGERSAAQIKAFDDTWHWDTAAAEALDDVLDYGGRPAEAMRAFETLLGHGDMLAYLSMMAPRLIELRRVLKPTGSLYLHCDPTASHYLKVLMDAVFGAESFRNEVAWKRTYAHGATRRWGTVHDCLLFYVRSSAYTWNRTTQAHGEAYLASKYRFGDDRGTYRLVVLTGPGVTTGESGQPWRGYDPRSVGRHWAVPQKLVAELVGEHEARNMTVHEKLATLDEQGYIHWPTKPDGSRGTPEVKRYLEAGQPIQDVILDVFPINSQAQERLGYPTQKPEALLERVVAASSNPGDLVLDPFCGCGTAVVAAQRLGRRWVGIDITHLAVNLMRTRLRDTFGDAAHFRVIGEPTTADDAEELARTDPYQFQFWALGLVGARPVEERKGADKGIDGRLYFRDDPKVPAKQVILSVKAGNLHRNQVHELRGVVDREGAALGVLISMQEPTRPMREEAASAGFYDSAWGTRHPRLQILTVGELLAGKAIDYPAPKLLNVTFAKAPKDKGDAQADQGELFGAV